MIPLRKDRCGLGNSDNSRDGKERMDRGVWNVWGHIWEDIVMNELFLKTETEDVVKD